MYIKLFKLIKLLTSNLGKPIKCKLDGWAEEKIKRYKRAFLKTSWATKVEGERIQRQS